MRLEATGVNVKISVYLPSHVKSVFLVSIFLLDTLAAEEHNPRRR